MMTRNVAVFGRSILAASLGLGLLAGNVSSSLAAGGFAPTFLKQELATALEEGDLAMTYRLGLVTVSCRDVPAGQFFFELARQTGISIRLERGAQYILTGEVRKMTLDRALARLMPKESFVITRGLGPKGKITAITVRGAVRPEANGDPVTVDAGTINLNPVVHALPEAMGATAPISRPAGPIHVMTDEELRADPTVEETSTESAQRPSRPAGAIPSTRR